MVSDLAAASSLPQSGRASDVASFRASFPLKCTLIGWARFPQYYCILSGKIIMLCYLCENVNTNRVASFYEAMNVSTQLIYNSIAYEVSKWSATIIAVNQELCMFKVSFRLYPFVIRTDGKPSPYRRFVSTIVEHLITPQTSTRTLKDPMQYPLVSRKSKLHDVTHIKYPFWLKYEIIVHLMTWTVQLWSIRAVTVMHAKRCVTYTLTS